MHTSSRLHRADLRGGPELLLWRQVALLRRSQRGAALRLLPQQPAGEEPGVREVPSSGTLLQRIRLLSIRRAHRF